MGENGAGKSTFIKVITGVHQPDSGLMLLEGEKVTPRNTEDSAKLGIAAIYQHVTAFPDLTVTENIFMGQEIKNKLGDEYNIPVFHLAQLLGLAMGLPAEELTFDAQQIDVTPALKKIG